MNLVCKLCFFTGNSKLSTVRFFAYKDIIENLNRWTKKFVCYFRRKFHDAGILLGWNINHLFLFGWIKIIIYLNSIPAKLLAHPHEAGGGSSSFYSHSVSHLKISTLFAHQQSQKPFRQILNQIKYSSKSS